jgi:hypothetical protein
MTDGLEAFDNPVSLVGKMLFAELAYNDGVAWRDVVTLAGRFVFWAEKDRLTTSTLSCTTARRCLCLGPS